MMEEVSTTRKKCDRADATSHFSFLIGDLFVHSILMEQAVDNQSTEEFFVDWFLMSVHL